MCACGGWLYPGGGGVTLLSAANPLLLFWKPNGLVPLSNGQIHPKLTLQPGGGVVAKGGTLVLRAALCPLAGPLAPALGADVGALAARALVIPCVAVLVAGGTCTHKSLSEPALSASYVTILAVAGGTCTHVTLFQPALSASYVTLLAEDKLSWLPPLHTRIHSMF